MVFNSDGDKTKAQLINFRSFVFSLVVMVWGGLLLYQTCAVLGIINVEYSIPFCHTGPEKWNKRLKSCVSVEGLNMRKWCLKISCFVWSFKNLEIIQQKEKTTNLHVWGTGNSKRLAFLLRYASVPFIQTDEVQQANIERAVWKMLMCVNNVSVLSLFCFHRLRPGIQTG